MVQIGDKYNMFTVLGPGEMYVSKSGKTSEKTWRCRCECGTVKNVRQGYLTRGVVKSCGCLHRYMLENGLHRQVHGDRGKRLYGIWKGMRERCFTRTSKNYQRYGGRGITVCGEWNDYSAFKEWALANGYREDLTIDRINVNGNYEPENCRWVTYQEQANNTRSNHIIHADGREYTMADYCRAKGLNYKRFSGYLHKGLTVSEATRRAS